ncbi:murein biosynthesis integral membrane protein MurJ [Geodermatophilus sp. URMC 60]
MTRNREARDGHGDQASRSGVVDAAAQPGRLLRTTVLVTVIYGLGSLFGLLRDVFIASYFGASPDTDAFLVAWTVPETVTPVLAEGVIIYLLVPMISRQLEANGTAQRVIDRTLLPAIVLLGALAGVVALAAPAIVAALGPGLAEPDLAVRCTRIASATVLLLGLMGYMTATLRATGSFVFPTWIYVIYNAGIVATMVLFHDSLGVESAALGLVVGSAGIVLVLAPAFLARVRLRSLRCRLDRRLLIGLGSCVPVTAYSLSRQAQVWVERTLASVLEPGAISHLNYAAKVAQIPMAVAGMVVLVAMPSLARHAAARRSVDLRRGVERSLRLGVLVIVPATVALVVFAPQLVEVLFLHGAFTIEDAVSTTEVMRVYCIGLTGQVVVGAAATFFWAVGSRTWFPATAMIIGLVATVVISAVSLRAWQTVGIALGNAAGISVAALVLLVGVHRRVVDLPMRGFLAATGLTAAAAAAAGIVAWSFAAVVQERLPALATALLGGCILLAVYSGAMWLFRVPEARAVTRMVRARLHG